LKFILDEKLSDYVTSNLEEFFQARIKKLESEIKVKMDMQLSNWIDDLINEQERIGLQVRADAESQLSL
jgi:hypothetical protein